MSVGSVASVLDVCTDAWLGSDLAPLTDEQEAGLGRVVLETTMNDHQVLAYAYKPILDPITCLPEDDRDEAFVYIELPHPANASRDVAPTSRPLSSSPMPPRKTDSPEPVESPNSHHSSSSSSRKGPHQALPPPQQPIRRRRVWRRLGLDTDWNSCILLSKPTDPHASPTYMERTDIKARLPRGVEAIREHLRDVDDIPLHVSLFAESSPPTVAGMLRVFQEHGEVVCAMGSTLNPANAEIFCCADLAVGVEPVHIKHQNQYAAGHVPPLALGSTLVSLPCPLVMHPGHVAARRLCRAARQAFMLVAATCGLVAMVQLFTVVSLLPVWRGWILMWLVWVALPLVAVTYASNVHEADTMKEFTERNLDHVKDLPRFLRYFVWRFLLPCVLTVWLYGVALSMTLPSGAPWTNVFISQASLEAEIVGGTCVAVFLLFASLTMLHRTLPFWEYRPLQNKFYCALVVVMLAVHFGIAFAVATPLIVKLPWHFHAVFFGSLPMQVAIHEQVKKWDRRQWLRFQKRSKLEFNTRLGMHSPI
ncbi:hypothetical protein BCR44DRAFT_1450894 [Catenaria anguillulae PL171]|uniref:Uncharacterized protein n=1 Tax=Catenaria anguillulae PL171 TaxID=765915 RepID=A0A1Y2H4F7_9FUNG|nr:hypothetical protein BCR44DRAFT_1450894 [Catenaria anguillulae PL171]